MRNDSTRRTAVKLIGTSIAVGSVGIAGCLGDENGEDDDTTPVDDPNGTIRGEDPDEWPDLSGQTVQYITDEGSPEGQEYWNGLGADFTQLTGAQVNVEFTGHGLASDERVLQLIQAGDPPEIYLADQDIAATFIEEGIVAPSTEFVEDYVINEQGFGEPTSSNFVRDGTRYGVPKEVQVGGIHYRSDLSDIDPVDQQSYYDYLEDTWENYDMGTIVPTSEDAYTQKHFISWAWTNNATICQIQDGEVVAALTSDDGDNREKLLDTIEHVKTLSQWSPPATDADWATGRLSLLQQTAAAPWYSALSVKDEVVRDEDADWGPDILRPPEGMVELRSTNMRNGGNVLLVMEGANTEAAYEFLRFLYRRENYIEHLVSVEPFALHYVPPYPNIAEDDEYLDIMYGWADEQEAYTEDDVDISIRAGEDVVSLASETAMDWAGGDADQANPFSGAITLAADVQHMVYDVVEGGMDPEEALEEYNEVINDTIAQTRGD